MFWLKKNPRKSTFWHFYSYGFIFVNSSALGMLWGRSLFFEMALGVKKISLDSRVLINDTNPWHRNKSVKHLKDTSSLDFLFPRSLSLETCTNLFSLPYSKEIGFESLIQDFLCFKSPVENRSSALVLATSRSSCRAALPCPSWKGLLTPSLRDRSDPALLQHNQGQGRCHGALC